MSNIAFELGVIIALILVNGIFATAEMAFVSQKKARLRKLAEAGNARARIAVALAAEPTRFPSSMQVGITLVGIIAGVYGGATLAEHLASLLKEIPWLSSSDSDQVNWRKIVSSSHTYFPVYEGGKDNLLGLVSVKSIYANLAASALAPLRDLLTPPLIVPESMTGVKLLETFKQSGKHLALVTDEFGNFSGMITLIDVLEAIVGSMPDELERKTQCRRRHDGSWLVDASMDIGDFKRAVGLATVPGDDSGSFQTVGSFVLNYFGRLPKEGDRFDSVGHRFEVIDVDKHRIDKVLVMPPKAVT